MKALLWITCGKGAKIARQFVGFAGEVWTNDSPTAALVRRFEQYVRSKVQGFRIERREYNGQRAIVAVLAAADRLWSDVRHFTERLIGSRKFCAVHDVGIEWVNGDVTVLEDAGDAPFAKGNFTIIAAALGGDASAFLLRTVNPVRKTVIGGDMVELCRWLVVPAAPGLSTIHTNGGTLIGGERDGLGVQGIDPDALIVVSTWST